MARSFLRLILGGVQQEAPFLATNPLEAQVGHGRIVHAGFALNLLSAEEAQETLRTKRA